ncbi:hypothetical protein CR513_24863, partial [Mucuna pruriens]
MSLVTPFVFILINLGGENFIFFVELVTAQVATAGTSSSTLGCNYSCTLVLKVIIEIQDLLSTLQVSCHSPTQLFCDNKPTLHIAANFVFYERIKHIEVDCHFIRENL